MIIDFHTHIFPETIAKNTLEFLEPKCHTKPLTNGMADGLISASKEALIDCSIVLPVVTKPSQFASINKFASSFKEAPLLSFGGIHPDTPDYKSELNHIKELGFRGIKLHPDYQNVFIDDIRYKRIISYASELGLIISVHAGIDPGFPDCVHCPPHLAAKVIDELKPERFVLAHLGGFLQWDEVEEYLIGKPIWLDTAVVFGHIPDEQFIRIARSHGMDKILFATDSPWASQTEFVSYLSQLPLSEEEKQMIFYRNAMELLNSVQPFALSHM